MSSAALNHNHHSHHHHSHLSQSHGNQQQQIIYGRTGSSSSQFLTPAAAAAAAPVQPTQRSHYSNRQQQQQQQQAIPRQAISNQPVQAAAAATSATSSDNDEQQTQLSSLSTGKQSNSSQQPMLTAHHNNNKRTSGGPSATTVRAMGGGGGHRQAALQSHTLGVGKQHQHQHQHQHSHHNHSNHSNHNHLLNHNHHSLHTVTGSGSTSSSDVPTSDDLHQFAAAVNSGTGAAGAPANGYTTRRALAELAASHQAGLLKHSSELELSSSSGQGGGGNNGNRFLLGVLFTLAELLLFGTIMLWLYWAYQHDDGLAWQSDRKQQFNTHAALMLMGFIFLTGQAMLIHRSFQCCSRIYTKIMHTILFVLATSAISLGLLLGYTAQENIGLNNKPIMHFYSLHAWCGLCTVALFCLQFAFGFISFLILLCCDRATANFRSKLLPIHRTFGLIIFSLAVATSLMGLLQTARSRLSSKLNKVDYHELAEPGIVINLIGVCLIGLAILMPYIIRNLRIKRTPFRSELLDRHLKLSQLEMRI